MSKKLISPFCRIGRKKPIQSYILSLFPKEFDTYVEPFVGSGDMFFFLSRPDIKAYLNDKNKLIYNGFKYLKQNPKLDDIDKYDNTSLEFMNKFVRQKQTRTIDKFAKIIYLLCGTFLSSGENAIYANSNIIRKIKKIPLYAEALKNTTITNNDYTTMFRYDSPSTFFYLDPPYEKDQKKIYGETVDYNEMIRYLKKLKGKFLVSLNDSPTIRELFKDFKMSSFKVKSKGGKINIPDRQELVISNY